MASLRATVRPFTVWLENQVPQGRRRRRREGAIYGALIGPGELCFDIGANVGNSCDTFLRVGARVVCVEPHPGNLRILRRRFAGRSDVTLVPQAVADAPGERELWLSESNDAIASTSEDWMEAVRRSGRMARLAWTRSVWVAATTLDALIADFGPPALCKIDVEGAEREVLRGLSQPLSCLTFEFHQERLEEARACIQRLETLGTYVFNYGDDRSPGLILTSWGPGEAVLARVAASGAPFLYGDILARRTDGPGR